MVKLPTFFGIRDDNPQKYLAALFYSFVVMFLILVPYYYYTLWIEILNLRGRALIYIPLFAISVMSASTSILTVAAFFFTLAHDALNDKKRRKKSLSNLNLRKGT
jgi:hypothetical protein